MSVKVLFVCLGNICRSPTAHGLFEDLVSRSSLHEKIKIDSAGTGDWHVGHPPDSRAQATALQRGYDISHLRARAVSSNDFSEFDYILGMDRENIRNLNTLCPTNYTGTLGLFLEIAGVGQGLEVPDPYYGGQEHFSHVIHLIEQGAEGLLARIQNEHAL
jgi:protein-tyrosine phosphatase